MSKIKKVGDLCNHCNTPLILKERSNKPIKGKYYYTHFLWCNNCKTIYMQEKYKKNVKNLFPKTTKKFGKKQQKLQIEKEIINIKHKLSKIEKQNEEIFNFINDIEL